MSDGAASLSHLLARAELVEDRVRELVQRRRADDPAPDDPFRGLYVNDQVVDRLLEPDAAEDPAAATEMDADAPGGGGGRRPTRTRRPARCCGCAGWPGTPG